MLAARAAYGHSQVVAGVLHVQGEPAADKARDIVDHGFDGAELGQPFGYGLVAPGQGAQSTVVVRIGQTAHVERSEEHTSELQSLMRISYAVFCLKKKKPKTT